jgi:hypothetical protein
MGAREVYQKTKKVPDLFWNRFVCRPLAAVLVSWLKDTRVTPNQITLASFVVGIWSISYLTCSIVRMACWLAGAASRRRPGICSTS